jgi:hypothetical protein
MHSYFSIEQAGDGVIELILTGPETPFTIRIQEWLWRVLITRE